MSATRGVVPRMKSTLHCYGERNGFGGCENDMSSEGDCGKSRQPKYEEPRGVICTYLWKLGQESSNTSWDKIHEKVVSVKRITVGRLSCFRSTHSGAIAEFLSVGAHAVSDWY